MKFSTRDLVTMAVFGVLWGVIEMTLGSVIKGLRIPFGGSLLSAIGIMIALIGRTLVPKTGSILFIGFIAMFLKLFSIGNIILGPMLGIIMEALIAEVVISGTGKTGRIPFLIASALAALWTLAQPFVTGLIFYGTRIAEVWIKMISSGARLLGINPDAVWMIAVLIVSVHLAVGVTMGSIAWDLGRQIQSRMRSVNIGQSTEMNK